MIETRYALYLDAVKAYLDGDLRTLNAFIESEDLSRAEKTLLRVRKLMQLGEYAKARETLGKPSQEEAFLKGEWHFLSGGLHSYLSNWSLAIVDAHKAASAFEKCAHRRGLFLSQYNLSVYYNRVGLDEMSLYALAEAAAHVATPAQESLILRAQACHFSRLSDFPRAITHLESALRLKSQLNELDRATLESVAADIFFRADLRERALASLNELVSQRAVRDKARVRFEATVLKALINRDSRYVHGEPPAVIFENIEYRLRWQTIAELQNGDWQRAQAKWEELCSLYPQRFKSDFECVVKSDERTVFMTAIYALVSRKKSLRAQDAPALSGKQRKLFEAMNASPIPLRKEELIEKVWETDYDPALDARFYKLVERMRKECGLKIEMVNQTYRLAS